MSIGYIKHRVMKLRCRLGTIIKKRAREGAKEGMKYINIYIIYIYIIYLYSKTSYILTFLKTYSTKIFLSTILI